MCDLFREKEPESWKASNSIQRVVQQRQPPCYQHSCLQHLHNMNESYCVGEWVMSTSRVNTLIHLHNINTPARSTYAIWITHTIWMSHVNVTCECGVSCMKESCDIWRSPSDIWRSHVTCKSVFVTCERGLSHMNASCHMWKSSTATTAPLLSTPLLTVPIWIREYVNTWILHCHVDISNVMYQ